MEPVHIRIAAMTNIEKDKRGGVKWNDILA